MIILRVILNPIRRRKFFHKIFKKFEGWARTSMKGIILVINLGIKAINCIVHLFGGNQLATISVNQLESGINFSKSCFAMINDAKVSFIKRL